MHRASVLDGYGSFHRENRFFSRQVRIVVIDPYDQSPVIRGFEIKVNFIGHEEYRACSLSFMQILLGSS